MWRIAFMLALNTLSQQERRPKAYEFSRLEDISGIIPPTHLD